jgi:1,2-phenylacetyl-CoA epoxidase PaaB subunit
MYDLLLRGGPNTIWEKSQSSIAKTLENTKGQSKNDNLEKLTTSGTQYEIKQSKNTTQCMLDTTMHTHTHHNRSGSIKTGKQRHTHQ